MATRARSMIVPALFAVAAVTTALGAVHAAAHALAHPGAKPVLEAVYAALRALVAGAFAVLTLGREEVHRRASSPVAFIACAVAMGAVLMFRSPSSSTPETLEVFGESVAVAACALLVPSVFALGRCFGVLPEARGLVTSGPYAVVRHPVYAAEIAAFVGLTVAAPVAFNAIALLLVLAAQRARMRFEERALTDAFPEYAQYAASIPALLPSPRLALAAAAHRWGTGRLGRTSVNDMTTTPEAGT